MTAQDRRRVLFVINDLRRAGAETQLVRLARGLDPVRYETRIVLLKTENHFATELAEAGVPVEALHRRGPLDIGVILRLARAIRHFEPDIAHSWLFLANLLTVLATRLVRVPALVLSQRSSYEATLPAFWRRVARLSHRFADRVIVNSQAALREEVAAGTPESLLVHIANGVDAPSAAPEADRPALGLGPAPLAVMVGQLAPEKDHVTLLEAWRLVVERLPDARLALVGDGPLRAGLEERRHRLGLDRHVAFIGFAEPGPWLAAADVAVLSSSTEGLPNAVLEAMAYGKAVVATRVGGIPELVIDAETGILVPARDPVALSGALRRVLGAPSFGAALGEAGRRRVCDCFSTARLVAETRAVYDSVPGRNRTSASTSPPTSTGPTVAP